VDLTGATGVFTHPGATFDLRPPQGYVNARVKEVVLLLGGNAARRVDAERLSVEDYHRSREAFCKRVASAFPSATVWLTSVLPRRDTRPGIIRLLDEQTRVRAKDAGIGIIQLPNLLDTDFKPDRVHLSGDGITKVLAAIQAIIQVQPNPQPPRRHPPHPTAYPPPGGWPGAPVLYPSDRARTYSSVVRGNGVAPPTPPPPTELVALIRSVIMEVMGAGGLR
jgi:hypothetical protein